MESIPAIQSILTALRKFGNILCPGFIVMCVVIDTLKPQLEPWHENPLAWHTGMEAIFLISIATAGLVVQGVAYVLVAGSIRLYVWWDDRRSHKPHVSHTDLVRISDAPQRRCLEEYWLHTALYCNLGIALISVAWNSWGTPSDQTFTWASLVSAFICFTAAALSGYSQYKFYASLLEQVRTGMVRRP